MEPAVRFGVAIVVLLVNGLGPVSGGRRAAANPLPLLYLSPRPGAQFVRPETTIAVRSAERISPDSLSPSWFDVVGSISGHHEGTVDLADDGRTVIFSPSHPFLLGEFVKATVRVGLQTTQGALIDGTSFGFSITGQRSPVTSSPFERAVIEARLTASPSLERPMATMDTLPADFPVMTATVTDTLSPDQYFFVAPFVVTTTQASDYIAILDGLGQPVFFQQTRALDFKVQPNGWITYYTNNGNHFVAMDDTYSIVDTFAAGNGYPTDAHELKLLPNGHAVLMIYDDQVMDLSQVVPGGHPDATVTGLVLQELDTSDNIVFEWRSWDHFMITDTFATLTDPVVDYVHGNAIEVDTDGNWLVSSRHLSEITKIDRNTGDILWRLGGKNNQYTFTNEPAANFAFQHDIRRLANGHISLFDNRTDLVPQYSRAVEYELDEMQLTATRIWEYRNSPDTYAFAMGNAQRLADGDTVIGWGTGGLVTEVRPDGSKAFELDLENAVWSYRAFRQNWHGHPTTPPTLVVHEEAGQRRLSYSWNGATEVASYRVYAGSGPLSSTLIDNPIKAGFETQTILTDVDAGCYFYQVVPVDGEGQDLVSSNQVTNCPYAHYMTWLQRP